MVAYNEHPRVNRQTEPGEPMVDQTRAARALRLAVVVASVAGLGPDTVGRVVAAVAWADAGDADGSCRIAIAALGGAPPDPGLDPYDALLDRMDQIMATRQCGWSAREILV